MTLSDLAFFKEMHQFILDTCLQTWSSCKNADGHFNQ